MHNAKCQERGFLPVRFVARSARKQTFARAVTIDSFVPFQTLGCSWSFLERGRYLSDASGLRTSVSDNLATMPAGRRSLHNSEFTAIISSANLVLKSMLPLCEAGRIVSLS